MTTRSVHLLAPAMLLVLAACGGGRGPVATLPGGVVMTDPMVAGITETANTGEVEQAQLALEKSQNAQVRQFAQMMINDHGRANTQLTALLNRENMSAVDSDVSNRLAQNSRSTVEALRTYNGADFDQRYMDAQVALHRWTLQSLDNTLIPAARDNQLEMLLREMRTTVASHLQQAERIRATL